MAAPFEEILAILSCVLNEDRAGEDSNNIRGIDPDAVVKRAVVLLATIKSNDTLYNTIRATKKKKVGNV